MKYLVIGHIILLCSFVLVFSCKTPQKKTKEVNFTYSYEKIDSILNVDKSQKNFKHLLGENNNDVSFQILSYGKKGDFGGRFSDGELDTPAFFLLSSNKTKKIDSLEIYKGEIGENVYRKKYFQIEEKLVKIFISEEWEDIETGEIERLDSVKLYQFNKNGVISLIDK